MSNEKRSKIGPFMGFFVGFALAAVLAAAGVFVYVIPKLDSKHKTELDRANAARVENGQKIRVIAGELEGMAVSSTIVINKRHYARELTEIAEALTP